MCIWSLTLQWKVAELKILLFKKSNIMKGLGVSFMFQPIQPNPLFTVRSSLANRPSVSIPNPETRRRPLVKPS